MPLHSRVQTQAAEGDTGLSGGSPRPPRPSLSSGLRSGDGMLLLQPPARRPCDGLCPGSALASGCGGEPSRVDLLGSEGPPGQRGALPLTSQPRVTWPARSLDEWTSCPTCCLWVALPLGEDQRVTNALAEHPSGASQLRWSRGRTGAGSRLVVGPDA